MSLKKVLVTGGAGFIGSNLVDDLLKNTDWNLTLLDRLDFSGNLNRLDYIGVRGNPRVRFVYHDLKSEINDQLTHLLGEQDYILHLAAGTHVDRSIEDPMSFVMDNVVATGNLLNHARKVGCEKFLYFSTDEVFGPAAPGVRHKEWDHYKSSNPYAATKAGGEELAVAFHNTYKVPVLITHTMNVIGRLQHWEKYAPLVMRKIIMGEELQIHSDVTETTPGSRFYIEARNVASALRFVLANGAYGDKFNIVGEKEMDNLELAKCIEKCMGKQLKYKLVSWHASRPGHDIRYALCGEKMASMGWVPPTSIERSLQETVSWYLENPQWLGLKPEDVSGVGSNTHQLRVVRNTAALSA